MLPCIFLASLTLVVFWLLADRPDRTGLGMVSSVLYFIANFTYKES